MSQKEYKNLSPDIETITAHIEAMFGDIKEHDDGKIEIAYTPSDSGAVNKAEYFTLDQIDEAALFAYNKNKQQGVNVYMGAALRSPGTAPFGRSNINDYYASAFIWCDLDDPDAAAKAKEKYSKLPPSFVVVTGRSPYTRAQAWWRLAVEEQNKNNLKHNLDFVCRALNGDPAVVDPARVMRIAGSVAWPKKAGRVPELTELITPKDATKFVMAERFQEYFVINDNVLSLPLKNNDVKPRDLIGNLKISDLLERTKTDGQWHINMRDAIAAMIGKGWNDEQIRISCAPYCSGGIYDQDLAPLIANARIKWNMPDIKEVINEETGEVTQSILSGWLARDNFQGQASEIRWLIEGIFPLGIPALYAAMGGLGKSFTVLDLAIKIASPAGLTPSRAFGGNVEAHGRVVYFSAEDSKESIHRRINAIISDDQLAATKDNLYIVPMPEIGHQLLIKDGSNGIETTEFFKLIRDELQGIQDIKLIVIDPLQAFVGADITSKPEAGQFMWSAFANICAKTGATLICTHHMRKDGLKNIKTAADAREAIRGSTALIDGSRLTYAMWQAGEDDGYKIAAAIEDTYEPQKFVRGAVVKTNDIADQTIHSYKRTENGLLVDLGNINISGVLSAGLTNSQAGQALREIRMAWEEGNPYRAAPQSSRCIVKWLMKTFRISREQAIYQRDNWMCPPLGSQPLIKEKYFKTEKREMKAGLYVVNIP